MNQDGRSVNYPVKLAPDDQTTQSNDISKFGYEETTDVFNSKMTFRCSIRRSLVGLSLLTVMALVIMSTKVTKDNASGIGRLIVAHKEDDYMEVTSILNNRHQSTDLETHPKIVIILAYMHTGSSYIGELLRQIPSTFYEYEPLRSAQMSISEGLPLLYLDDTNRTYKTEVGGRIGINPTVSLLRAIVTCNHHQLDVGSNTNFFFGAENPIHRDYSAYINCVAGKSAPRKKAVTEWHFNLLPFSYLSTAHVKECIHLKDEDCSKAKVRLSKHIRLSLEVAYNAVRTLDNVRILHLVRDPRAMMDSQLRKNNFGVGKSIRIFEDQSKMMCDRMREDLKLVKNFRREYPSVLFTQRYENIADKPIETAKEIYDFIGEKFSTKVETFVRSESVESNHNSTVRQAVWRGHITQKHLDIVDKHCSDLYSLLGYISLRTISQVRDLSVADYVPDVDLNQVLQD